MMTRRVSALPLLVRCHRCGSVKDARDCRGNDSPCHEGGDGGAARACGGWSGYCCRCGERWAMDQM